MTRYTIAVSAALAFAGLPAAADELSRAELERRLSDYEARIQQLEQRPNADSGSAFNPALSLTLMGQLASYSGEDELHLPGFQLGGEAGLPSRGLSLDHTELTLSANIDPYFFGQTTLALASHGGDTEVELEEAFIETLGLPGGIGLTFGRFFSAIGYMNSQHRHVWDFVDAPLPVQAFLGGNYYDDGVRLSWLAPTTTFLEVGAEVFRGGRFPAAENGDTVGAWAVFAKLGGDVGFSHSWQLGLSHLRASPEDREGGGHHHGHGHDEHEAVFSGDSELSIVDLVWKWAPGGGVGDLTLQTEYFHRRENGRLELPHAGQSQLTRYDGRQRGWYGQAVYQFLPRWRVGARYDRLWSDNDSTDRALLEEAGLADTSDSLHRASVMLDFSTSEFGRFRLQYSRSELDGDTGHAGYLQYVMSLGAHGAHRY